MARPTVFVALLELAPEAGCEFDAAEIAGAAVRCYVAAPDDDSAMMKVIADLGERCFRLVDVEWCVDHDTTEWDKPNDAQSESSATLARETGEVIYDTFHTWGHDAPDA